MRRGDIFVAIKYCMKRGIEMKKTMKKLLTLVLTLCCCASVLCGHSLTGKATQGDFFEKSNVAQLALNTPTSGVITEKGNRWYTFTTNASNDFWYVMELKNTGFYCYSRLYDSDGANIETVYTGRNETKSKYVKLNPSSVYFVQVHGEYDDSCGNFVLNMKAENDEGDTLATASPIANEYSGTIKTENDVDWLSFNSGANTAVTVTVKNIDGSGVTAQVFKADETSVSDSYYAGKAQSNERTVLVNAGTTYYIKVTGYYDDVRYKISISGRVDEPSKAKKAKSIKLKKNVNGILDTDDDHDWFKVKANKKGNYKFIIKNIDSTSIFMSVYKGNKRIDYVYAGKADTNVLKLKLKKGTYRIEVSGNAGKYAVKVKR